MAYGNGGVTQRGGAHTGQREVGALHEQHRYGFADDIGATDDHDVSSGGRNIVAREQLAYATWGSRYDRGQSLDGTSHVLGRQSVHILAIVDGREDGGLVDMRRQRELDDEAVDSRVGIEALDLTQQIGFADICLQGDTFSLEAYLLAGLDLVGYVGLGGRVVTNDHDAQTRHTSASLAQGIYLCAQFGTYGGCYLFSV